MQFDKEDGVKTGTKCYIKSGGNWARNAQVKLPPSPAPGWFWLRRLGPARDWRYLLVFSAPRRLYLPSSCYDSRDKTPLHPAL